MPSRHLRHLRTLSTPLLRRRRSIRFELTANSLLPPQKSQRINRRYGRFPIITPFITPQLLSKSWNGAVKLAISSCADGPVNWPRNDEGVGPRMSKEPEKVVLPEEKTVWVNVYRGTVGVSKGPLS